MRERAAEMREAFDRSFASAPPGEVAPAENLLVITVKAQRYAIKLGEVAGLFADKKVTRLPTAVASLAGIAGFRGTVLPVYDLGLLLGYSHSEAPRWLVITAGVAIGLAFDGFDSHLRVRPDAITPEQRTDRVARHVREIVQADVILPIVHIPSVLTSIKNLVPDARTRSDE